MSIAKTSINRPLMMTMVILAITLFGIVAWQRLPIDRMPDMALPYVTVQAIYPGSGPEEIETNVVKPLEEQISTIGGMKSLTSYCMENAAYLVIKFNDDVNGDQAVVDVKDKIDQIIGTLPEDLRKPVVSKFDPNDLPVISFAVTGNMSAVEMRSYVDEEIKDLFGTIDGVAKVDVTGGREREIVVKLNPEKMSAHWLSIFQVAPLLELQNLAIPVGNITGKSREYSVRMDGEFKSIEEIKNIRIPVTKQYGENVESYQIRLADIAEISDSYKEVRSEAKFNGKESVQIGITKSGDANTAATAALIMKKVEQIKKNLPAGMDINLVQNRAIFIQNSVDDTYDNINMGIWLTALILFVFLFDWRVTVIAAVTMPVSLIMGLIGVQAMGFSLNMITMMALTIAVGILVTNSIIVIENIVRHRNEGMDVKQAALVGSDEIFMSILASTLTNLVVFIPIASTTGITGAVFKSLGLTIVFATIASIFLSFTLVPLMAAKLLKPKKVGESKVHFVDAFYAKLDKFYAQKLDLLLRNRLLQVVIIGGSLGFFIFTMAVIAPKLGSESQPAMDEGFIDVAVELPAGTSIDVTRKTLETISQRVKDTPHLVATSSTVGGSGMTQGVQYGTVKIQITPEYERDITVYEIVKLIRPKLADIPDAIISVKEAKDLSTGNADIVLDMTGPDLDTLVKYSNKAKELMLNGGGLTDIASSWKGEKPQILITPNRDRMEHYGLAANLQQSATIQMVGGMLRYSVNGNDEAIYRENGNEYPIRVQMAESARETIRDIETMEVMTPRGPIPLEAIATVEHSGGVSSITRKNRERMIQLSANMLSGDAGTKTRLLNEQLSKELKLPQGYEFKFAGNQEMMEEMNEQMGLAFGLAVVLTLMVLIGTLESISMGLVIFATIPMGIIGVIWGLYLTNSTISMISLLSVVMLVGVVVNNAILLIDYARHHRHLDPNLSAHDAIVRAAEMKLKPILMSNLAIIVSMIPMALAMGAGGSFRAPFAITAIAGVLVSTVMTFFAIPILYIWTAPKHEAEEIGGDARAELDSL